VTSSAVRILELYFLIILQENIDAVTAERLESVGEEDSIKIETEEDYIQLVRTVKTEEEVSVVCWCVLWL
jgi:CRISPR/Cas system-associated protein Csx1